jgi:hypothetical protein
MRRPPIQYFSGSMRPRKNGARRALHYVPPLFAFVLGIIMASCLRRHLGLSFVAAFQTASFPKVEGWNYSSVMATSNFRYAIESLFAAFARNSEARRFRRPYVFGAMCIAFGMGAAICRDGSDTCLQPRHSRNAARDCAGALRDQPDGHQGVAAMVSDLDQKPGSPDPELRRRGDVRSRSASSIFIRPTVRRRSKNTGWMIPPKTASRTNRF